MFGNSLVTVNINFSSEENEQDHNLKGIEELKRRVSKKKKEKRLVECWETVWWQETRTLMLAVIKAENF